MKFKLILHAAVVLIFFCSFPPLAGKEKKSSVKRRPRVGVVLSGGGAKGFAHVAILRRLEKLGIPVDYIGGTSMGGTVAALYSMGYTVDELERIAYDTDWYSYFSNEVKRSNRSSMRKSFQDLYPFSLNIAEKGIDIPRGLVNGQRMGLFLSKLTWGAHEISNYEKLHIPFICIATDMETGEGKVMAGGHIAESLRATMAIPTIFSPVEIDGRIYLDGGVVNNFPVKEVISMGADIIIGVDVGAPLYRREDLNSLAAVMEQATSFAGMKTIEAQRKRCDILITPDITDFTATSFEKTAEIIAAGEKATDRQIDKLLNLAAKFKKYSIAPRKRIVPSQTNSQRYISEIVFHGLREKIEKIVRENVRIKVGDKASADNVEEAVAYLYGTGFFKRISYSIEKRDDGSVLNLYFKEKPESSINFGLSYDIEMKSAILIGGMVRNLWMDNTLAVVNARVGEYSKLDAQYFLYTPIDPGVGIGIGCNLYDMDVYLYRNGIKTASYNFNYYNTSLFLSTFFSNWFNLSASVKKEFFEYEAEITDISADEEFKFDIIAGSVKLKIDTLNKYHYPSSGFSFEDKASYVYTDLAMEDENIFAERFWHNSFITRFAIPLGEKLTFIGGGASGFTNSKNVPPVYQFVMGGYQRFEDWIYPLNGYNFMERMAQHGWVYFTHLQYEFIKDFFITAKWNEGKATDSFEELFKYGDTDAGFGLTLGYSSVLGPVEVSVFRKRDIDDYIFQVNLGLRY